MGQLYLENPYKKTQTPDIRSCNSETRYLARRISVLVVFYYSKDQEIHCWYEEICVEKTLI